VSRKQELICQKAPQTGSFDLSMVKGVDFVDLGLLGFILKRYEVAFYAFTEAMSCIRIIASISECSDKFLQNSLYICINKNC
jgi:hypothetical protein